MQLIDADTSLDESEKQRRKQVELQTSLSLSYTAITPPPISCVSV